MSHVWFSLYVFQLHNAISLQFKWILKVYGLHGRLKGIGERVQLLNVELWLVFRSWPWEK